MDELRKKKRIKRIVDLSGEREKRGGEATRNKKERYRRVKEGYELMR